MTESIADDYDYNVQGSGSEEYSTTRPKKEMTEIDIEKETTTSGLCFNSKKFPTNFNDICRSICY